MGVRIMGHWTLLIPDFRRGGRDTSVGGTDEKLNGYGADRKIQTKNTSERSPRRAV